MALYELSNFTWFFISMGSRSNFDVKLQKYISKHSKKLGKYPFQDKKRKKLHEYQLLNALST